MYNLFAGTEILSLSVYEPIAVQIVLGEEGVIQFGRGIELEGRVLYPVKLLHIRYNLFAGTEMLSLSPFTSQSQYKFSLGDRPSIWGLG
jgi:hypothetical protein